MVGDRADFSIDNRAFNAICVTSFFILLFLLPFNMAFGLWPVCIMIAVLLLYLVFFYYLSRIKKRYRKSIVVYAVASYLTLICTFFFNSGSSGPTLFLFFLTFQLLAAFTVRKLHTMWFVVHLLVPLVLLLIEFYRPGWVPYTYKNKSDRLIDLFSTYFVILIFMYLVTTYLRNSYNRENKVSEARAAQIEAQNAQLALLNQQKNKLFSLISHDLRSPFGTMISIIEVLEDAQLGVEEKLVFINNFREVASNALDMLSNLLSWSRAQMDGIKVNLQPIAVGPLVNRVLQAQQVPANRKQIAVNLAIPPGIRVLADTNMMELVIRNLLNNAIKFTPVNGVIAISACVNGDNCKIEIKDNGAGIKPEHLQQLFTLNTISTYGTNMEKGRGLGLYLCREFIALQNGSIQVNSIVGEGSTFIVSLPAIVEESIAEK